MGGKPLEVLAAREPSPGTAYVLKNSRKYGPRQRVGYLANALHMKKIALEGLLPMVSQVQRDIEDLKEALKDAEIALEAL